MVKIYPSQNLCGRGAFWGLACISVGESQKSLGDSGHGRGSHEKVSGEEFSEVARGYLVGNFCRQVEKTYTRRRHLVDFRREGPHT